MSNHPNRAHTEAPAMSFEQQVAQVLDSLTKELPMSEPPAGPLGAANEYAARSTAGTIIPDLGITFAEAAERYRSLRRAEMEANQQGDQGVADDANRRHCELADQIMDATPSTPADAMVILSMLADREMGIVAGIDDERAQRALERVYGLLSAAGRPLGQSEEGELSAMVCRWLELRDIVSPTKRQMAEHDRLFDRIAAYQPHTAADALALLVFVLTCYMGDSIIELQDDGSGYARALQKGLAYLANAGDPAAGTLYRLGPIGLISERAFWVDPEAGGKIVRHEHREAEVLRDEADDDAELLDLWRQYLPLKAEAERIDEETVTGDAEAWERAHKPCDELEERMAAIPARTPAGIAVKLAVLWQWGGAVVERGGSNNERENGPDHLSDHMVQWLWMIMNEARALGAPMPLLPNDTTTDMAASAAESRRLVLEIESEAPADPFGEAVAEIAGSAPDALSMPLELTDRMIDAGASAAGITPEQFKAAVIAARDARAA